LAHEAVKKFKRTTKNQSRKLSRRKQRAIVNTELRIQKKIQGIIFSGYYFWFLTLCIPSGEPRHLVTRQSDNLVQRIRAGVTARQCNNFSLGMSLNPHIIILSLTPCPGIRGLA
jgi:hypothetical protein